MKREKMKKRLIGMLEADKEEISEQTKRVFLADFLRLAEEYFDGIQEESVSIARNGEGLRVCIQASAIRVKNFSQIEGGYLIDEKSTT